MLTKWNSAISRTILGGVRFAFIITYPAFFSVAILSIIESYVFISIACAILISKLHSYGSIISSAVSYCEFSEIFICCNIVGFGAVRMAKLITVAVDINIGRSVAITATNAIFNFFVLSN